MTLQKGDILKTEAWGDPEYEIVSDPIYLTDGEGETSYVVGVVLKETLEINKKL